MPADLFGRQLARYRVEDVLADAPTRYLELFRKHDHVRAFVERDGSAPPPDRLFDYRDFEGFLVAYLFSSYFIRSVDDFRDLIAAVAQGLDRDRVAYAEVIVSIPEYLMHGLPLEGLVEALSDASETERPKMRWIVDLVRNFGPEPGMRLLERLLANRPEGWVGVTLGGSEHLFPPGPFKPVYEQARSEGLKLSVHAGEAAGPESVWEAIRELNVDRIGHGVRSIEDPQLVLHLVENEIPLEICPTSNLRTGVYQSIDEHPLGLLHHAGVPITLNTDDPTFFKTDLDNEIEQARRAGLGDAEIRQVLANAWRFAFS